MTSSSARALGLALGLGLGLGLALFPELASGLWRRLPLRLELARSLFPEDMMALRSLQKMRPSAARRPRFHFAGGFASPCAHN
jgi:hypothetical protein